MGKRGPKPTPTALLKARGSWRGKANRNEPAFSAAPPPCPGWLGEKAKEYWKQLRPMLSTADVLRKVDGAALARYCQLLSRYQACEEFIMKNGDTFPVKDESGKVVGVKEFPQVRRASDLSAQLVKLEAEFGMTPSSRGRLVVGAVKPAADAPKPSDGPPPPLRIAQ